MEIIERLLTQVNARVVWGIPMMTLMLGCGLLLTVATKGLLLRRFGTMMQYTLKTLFEKQPQSAPKEGITPFQAVCTALAATVGTGNIVGVAAAIAVGGPGALFWLWVSALLGMAVKYAEVTLAVAYRRLDGQGQRRGGPMYYIEKGLGKKWAAVSFSVCGMLASFGIGAGVQANAMAGSLHSAFGWRTDVIGVAAALAAGLVLLGGIRRIASAAEVLVPFMSLLYIGGAAVVLILHAREIPAALQAVWAGAFHGTAAQGGFLGASIGCACRMGLARGVFTHEAGMGSAPIAHAAAATDHPARQGLWGAFEVFFDSLVLCTVSGLVILTTGVWQDAIPSEAAMSVAFERGFAGGSFVVTVGLALFAFATVISWYYYGEKCVEYVCGERPAARTVYTVLYVLTVFAGSVAAADAVWELTDLFNGLMALPNLAAVLMLTGEVRRLTGQWKMCYNQSHRQ